MNEIHTPPEVAEELKRLDLKIGTAGTMQEKDELSKQRLSLVKQKVGINRRLDDMRKKMHSAAEEAERAGVGTGGKGSPED